MADIHSYPTNNEFYLPLCNTQKGETGANVLVGFQIPTSEMEEFQNRANGLGYSYMEETSNYAFQLLMR